MGYRQLHAVVAVVLNFHAKTELETLQSGAGRPPLGRPAWDFVRFTPTFSWALLSSLDGGGWLRRFEAEICRPAGLGLAHLGLPFHRHLDQRVHAVYSGVPGQRSR